MGHILRSTAQKRRNEFGAGYTTPLSFEDASHAVPRKIIVRVATDEKPIKVEKAIRMERRPVKSHKKTKPCRQIPHTAKKSNCKNTQRDKKRSPTNQC
jgi:hypothetical protein